MREAGARCSWWAAVGAVAATYFYFLIFAEFAWLELARALAAEADRLRIVMAALGAGGVLGAVAAGRWFRRGRRRRMLAWGFRACAAAAALAPAVAAPGLAVPLAAGIGLALGFLTVVLAAVLRAATDGRRLGLAVGAGTGAAYAACNVPGVFEAAPAAQAWLAAAVVLAASLLPRLLVLAAVEPLTAPPDYDRGGVLRGVGVLLALVWMDSAAFYVIQHAPALRAATWSGAGQLWGNAAVHLVAALAAGVLLDRGGRRTVLAAAAALLSAACLTLNGALPPAVPAGGFYVAGVSLYSAALVEYPARSGRAGLGALVFAVAGWVGSALGIGMAQDLARIPGFFVAAAGAAVAVLLGWRGRAAGRGVAIVALAAVAGGAGSELRAGEPDPLVAQGREVYIAEGCVHCHSQYIRPRVAADVEWWGPARPLAAWLAETPPLPGNRRQGPDLANVGNRRSPEWNRLHLIAPRAVSPGSRMPSYAHLFAAGDGRGEALLAYLAVLGGETRAERQALIAAWRPAPGAAVPPEAAGRLFQRLCAACHGAGGRGDGPLAARLSLRPADWTREPWRHIAAGSEPGETLARIIKFGLPGLPMAGHETLPDAEVTGLVRFVQALHRSAPPASLAGDGA
jgi:mono/diheme cytochrome c family protein